MPQQHSVPSGVSLEAPTAEHHRVALGIGEAAPRLSWTVRSAPPGWTQDAYEIEIGGGGETRRSGRVPGAESVLVPWPTAPLGSRERRTVRVRVWGGGADGPSPWSPPLDLETGLLRPDDWSARMVTPADGLGDDERPVLLRGVLELPAPARSARLYITAHGLYQAELNGVRVGDEELDPGWTSYHQRLRYRTHDVTRLLRPGRNALGVWLAEGWYRGRLGFHGGSRAVYGDRTGLLAQLEVECADGSVVRFGTDENWKAAPSPILFSGLYDGEHHDARLETPGWSLPDFDDSHWSGVRTVERDRATLVAPLSPPVRCVEEVAPVATWTSPSGRRIVDFGQNLVGRLRLRVSGPAGTEVTLRHAEVLQDGELCTRPLRHAAATDRYVLSGDGVEEWEPRFTYHGFRYAEVTGWPGEWTDGAVVARVLHTDLRPTGSFTCSDPLLQRLHDNVVWSMRGNFVDIPTDCPQRDERLGWTGDIQVFAPTASFLYDCSGMLASWLADLAVEQYPDGTVPFVVPTIDAPTWTPAWPAAVWGDVAVLLPWTLYQRFGDDRVLRDQYASATAWVDLVASRLDADGVWRADRQLGDWLDPAAPPEDPFQARTDPTLVATAYFAASARTMADTARVLGRTRDQERYSGLAERARASFGAAFVRPGGRLTSDTQTAYTLALHFDLIPGAAARGAAADRLAELVAEEGHRIATGFAGTPLVCDVLAANGHLATAYRLLLQRECPSWLYAVLQGATTVWERWDSLLPDGRVNPGEMTSFNHYALGAVADWLHRTVAGLAPDAPGYRRLRVAPRPGGGLEHAGASHLTPYGRAEVRWRRRGGELLVDVTVPTGTTAVVDLPGTPPVEVAGGRHGFRVPHPPADADEVPAQAAGRGR
ncbi:glycoside hydrolase family 78 protein [Thermobifida halotolerans]|uniref:alpha-L-rhamnosidase n=1 Tax=Thermobifida halotolerans TaxID=483545 RepID=A0AA97M578_9ACTN|nr:glycoside hydrolase family 78 protein [Thermobifida halotolerans]UOE21164.1 glycoside hydrolase family 78 protein [Thermobifida halotolerans]